MKRSMWTTAAVVILGAICLTMAPDAAHAVQDEEAFAALRADLEHRRDNELAAPEGKTAKKQRKAVLKCLKLLDKKSTKRSSDIKIAGKCAAAVTPRWKPRASPFAKTSCTISSPTSSAK